MAIFKNFDVEVKGNRVTGGETNTGVVVNPSDGDIWIDGQPYDSDTLYPLFDKSCKAFKNFITKSELAGNHYVGGGQLIAKGPCLLNGQTTGVATLGGQFDKYKLGSRDHNLEDDQVINCSSPMFKFTSTGSKNFYLKSYTMSGGNYYAAHQPYTFIQGDDFSNPEAVLWGNYDMNTYTYGAHAFPLYVDTTNKYIYFFNTYSKSNSGSYYYRSIVGGISRSSYTTLESDGAMSISAHTVILEPNSNGTYGNYHDFVPNSFYYCGKNNDNTLMFLEYVIDDGGLQNQDSTDLRIAAILNAESYNVSNGSVSSVATLTTSNLTDSTKAVKYMVNAHPSNFKQSPISGETNVYYSYRPIADTNKEISFMLTTWDKSANSNAGSVTIDNCTMTYSSGVVTDYLTFPSVGYNVNGRLTRSNCFITKTGTSYYLHYLPAYGSPDVVAAQSAPSKNLVTYSIDATDFSNLTYHSSVQVNAQDFVYLNSGRTKIAVISPSFLKVYTWNNGWVETASESGNFTGVTQDASGRIIGVSTLADIADATASTVDANFKFLNHKVHLISDSLPNNVTIEFASSSLTYTGSNISTSVNVNAYNSSNARVAKSVTLKIDGANATFSNNTTSIATTTSTSADTSVAVTVTGPGPITISAALTL